MYCCWKILTQKKTKVLISFSLIENSKKLFCIENKSEQLHCLHGMRFLSMCWVMIGHVILFLVGFIDNPLYLRDFSIDHLLVQLLVNATFSVDTFFFMSGLLVAYILLNKTQCNYGNINPVKMILLRYLRLTPLYAFCLLMSNTLWLKLGEGPMFYQTFDFFQKSCSKYWWTNLLYINNLYPSILVEECFGWSWYLANDMQFFILTSLLVYILHKNRKVMLCIIFSLISASVILTGVMSSITQQQPQVIQIDTQINPNVSKVQNTQYSPYMYDLYTKPYYRISVYLIGFLTGCFLNESRKSQVKINKFTKIICWFSSTIVSLLVIFGLYGYFKTGELLDNNLSALYNCMSRNLFAVSLSWITIACVNGHAEPINNILSAYIFQVLSKLTFAAYLIHPLVYYLVITSNETPMHITILLKIVLYLGLTCLTYFIAFLLHIFIELPISNLIKLMVRNTTMTSIRNNDLSEANEFKEENQSDNS